MHTVSFRAEVGVDGKLRVEVPVGLPPGPVNGVVVFDEAVAAPPPFNTLEGILAGKLSADINIDAALKEMNDAWKQKLEPLSE
ncbi:MAG TPA: hypothetical protein VIM11_13910 [Tepidisphaeraceae bacterium]|jgi:hypothetical protein